MTAAIYNEPGASNEAMRAAYDKGYESKSAEILGNGWIAARDAFNLANPPGQKWTGSAQGLAYSQGEFQALCDKMDRRVA